MTHIAFISLLILSTVTFASTHDKNTLCSQLVANESSGSLAKLRLDKIRADYQSYGTTKNISALTKFLRNKDLIRQNGVVYVVGPGSNFYEWTIFLLARPDISIEIFELNHEKVRQQITSENQLRYIWQAVTRVNPELLTDSSVQTFDEFKSQVTKRIKVFGAFSGGGTPINDDEIQPAGSEATIPRADLIFANYPFNNYTLREETKFLRNDGLFWIQSENIAHFTNLNLQNTTYIEEHRHDYSVSRFFVTKIPEYAWSQLSDLNPTNSNGDEATSLKGIVPSRYGFEDAMVYFIIPYR